MRYTQESADFHRRFQFGCPAFRGLALVALLGFVLPFGPCASAFTNDRHVLPDDPAFNALECRERPDLRVRIRDFTDGQPTKLTVPMHLVFHIKSPLHFVFHIKSPFLSERGVP